MLVVLLHELALVWGLRGGCLLHVVAMQLRLMLLLLLMRVALHLISQGIRAGRGWIVTAYSHAWGWVHPGLRPWQGLFKHIIRIHIRPCQHIQRVSAILPTPLQIFGSRVYFGLERVLFGALVAHHGALFTLLLGYFNLSLHE